MSRSNPTMIQDAQCSSTPQAIKSSVKSRRTIKKNVSLFSHGNTRWRIGVVLQGLCLLLVLGGGPAMAESNQDGKFKKQHGNSTKSFEHFKHKTKKKPDPVSLAVRLKGEGIVTSTPSGLSCRQGTCRAQFPWGTVVKLKASPDNGQVFAGWRGACGGSQKNCALYLKNPQYVSAVFTPPPPVKLLVRLRGEGSVLSKPEGLSCKKRWCFGRFPAGTTVTLMPQPGEGQAFGGWRGACTGSATCTLPLKHSKLVGAIFTEHDTPVSLSLTVFLDGAGKIVSTPPGISCSQGTCKGEFPRATVLTLRADPSEGHSFAGWTGACTGTTPCVMTLMNAQEVKGTFTPLPPAAVPLLVAIVGNGRVVSEPSGVSCISGTCVGQFEPGQVVTLLTEPGSGQMFSGWSGSCTAVSSCRLTLTAPMSVTATFAPIPNLPVALSVFVAGGGEVVSSPTGIVCSSGTCVEDFPHDSTVTLQANPNPNHVFSGWSGACTGMGSCIVALPSPMLVTATFSPLATGLTDAEARRFLEQATWGPTPALMAHVKAIGKAAFLDEQFSASQSTYPDPVPDSSSLTPVRNQFFHNAFHGQDQLRQRMAFALGQIFVVSANKVGEDYQMVPYLRLLHQGAFGNYQDVMRGVTLSPTMGVFLDMVNNDKTVPGSGLNPNENYPREFLQLFSVGTRLLNPDGSEQVDSSGNPIPPYDQDVILNLSRVMTGWTYPTQPGATPRWRNPSYFNGPMEAIQSHHDVEAKELMNSFILPAGQTAQEDLNQAIQHVFQHPNVGPFVVTRLIRHFVASNPSPQYVSRVVQVFNANANGVRGDLPSVLKAILLDPEAASATPGNGHLREPILFEVSLLRAMGATVNATNPLYNRARDMGQDLFSPPSVFNYFSPLYRIPGTPLFGPEFQIHNYSSSIARANFVYQMVTGGLGAGASVDLVPYETLAANPAQLVTTIARLLLHEPLSPLEQQIIVSAITHAGSTNTTRVRNAVYLIAASSRYQVQH